MLAELEPMLDSLIVILNDKLLDVLGDDVTQGPGVRARQRRAKGAVGGINDIDQSRDGVVSMASRT